MTDTLAVLVDDLGAVIAGVHESGPLVSGEVAGVLRVLRKPEHAPALLSLCGDVTDWVVLPDNGYGRAIIPRNDELLPYRPGAQNCFVVVPREASS